MITTLFTSPFLRSASVTNAKSTSDNRQSTSHDAHLFLLLPTGDETVPSLQPLATFCNPSLRIRSPWKAPSPSALIHTLHQLSSPGMSPGKLDVPNDLLNDVASITRPPSSFPHTNHSVHLEVNDGSGPVPLTFRQ